LSTQATAGARPTPLPVRAFDDAVAAFEVARQNAALSERHYRIAGHPMRVRIVGPALARELEKSPEHLRVEPDRDSRLLSVDVWHEAETGVRCPSAGLDSTPAQYGILTTSEDRRFVAEQRPHSMSWLDRRTGRVIVWVTSVDRLHVDERARPFHRPLSLRLGDEGIQFVHAGLTTWQGRGALFTGKGGSGKSTTSICCLLGGFGYLGDDFVGLEAVGNGRFRGHSLYGAALTTLGHMQRFPALAAVSAKGNHPHEEKSIAWLSQLPDARFLSTTSIDAIVLPKVTLGAEDTVFEPASPREALLALAPSSVLYLPAARPGAMDRLAALVESVPSFRLLLGRDVSRIPGRVQELLASA
jgi:hypothetical protein